MKNILYKLFIIAILFTFGIKSNLPAQDDLIRTIGMGTLDCIAYSPDGTKLASAGGSGYVYIWDINTGNVIDTLKGHTSWVLSVAFSPDGSKIASVSGDNTIKLWNANTGALIRTFKGHNSSVESIAFSPDGSKIASGSGDGTIKIWRIPQTPQKPEKPYNLKASAGYTEIKLSWEPSKTLGVSYKIYRSLISDSEFNSIKENIMDTTYTDSNLSVQKYYYYVVAVKDSVESDPSDTVSAIPLLSGVNDFINYNKSEIINIFPNPASDYLTIKFLNNFDSDITISIFNNLGMQLIQKKYSINNKSNSYHVNIKDLLSGIYYATIETTNHIETVKFVIIK